MKSASTKQPTMRSERDRVASRLYRDRRRRHIADLERIVAHLRAENSQLQQERDMLAKSFFVAFEHEFGALACPCT